MNCSLNETQAMAMRAARGAGYSWGLAEETGRAVRWLCANGLDGCAELARLLEQTDSTPKKRLSPVSLTGEWVGASGQLCPLMAGAALSDCAERLGKREIVMRHVLRPALVLPFAAAAASQKPVTVAWKEHSVVCDALGKCGAARPAPSSTSTATALRVKTGGRIDQPQTARTRATPDAADWAALARLALRTYAPATEASRLLGAGTGLSDTD